MILYGLPYHFSLLSSFELKSKTKPDVVDVGTTE